MLALINFFVELCLLRRTPQDLPASLPLFGLLAVGNLCLGLMAGLVVGEGFGRSLLQSAAEILLTTGVLFAGLRLVKRESRFAQSATALLGSGAVFGLLGLFPLALLPAGEEAQIPALFWLLLIGLLIWNLVVMGHILRHTLELKPGQGMLIAVAFYLLASSVLGGLFASPA